jgi:hypothetical protein
MVAGRQPSPEQKQRVATTRSGTAGRCARCIGHAATAPSCILIRNSLRRRALRVRSCTGTYGIPCKAIIDAVLDSNVSRVHLFGACFAGVVFPGETMPASVWKANDKLPATVRHRAETTRRCSRRRSGSGISLDVDNVRQPFGGETPLPSRHQRCMNSDWSDPQHLLAQLCYPGAGFLAITQPSSLGRIVIRYSGHCVHRDFLQVESEGANIGVQGRWRGRIEAR